MSDENTEPKKEAQLAKYSRGSGLAPDSLGGYLPALDSDVEINLHDYLRILKRNRWIIVAFTLLLVSIVTVASFKMQPIYIARARIEIGREQSAGLLFSTFAVPDALWDSDRYLETRAKILESESLALQTVERLNLEKVEEFSALPGATGGRGSGGKLQGKVGRKPSIVDAFLDRLAVEPDRRSFLVTVEFESEDPELAATVVNTHIDTFIQHNLETRYQATVKASEWMAKELEDIKVQVEKAEDALVAYERENQIWSLGEKEDITTEKLAELSQRLTSAQVELIKKRSAFEVMQSGNPDALPAVRDSKLIEGLFVRQSELRDQYTDARARFGPNFPQVLRLEARLEELNQTIERQKKLIGERLKAEYQEVQKEVGFLAEALDQQKGEAANLADKLVHYNILRREADTNKQLYEGMLQRLKEAGVSAGLRSSNIHVVDPALAPDEPSRPRKTLNIALSILLGLMGGVGIAFLREYLDRSVKSPTEAERLVGLPTLGVIPLEGYERPKLFSRFRVSSAEMAKKSSGLAIVEPPSQHVSESFRSLRTQVLLSQPEHPPSLILVTSALPNEGKTTVCINLALTFAQLGDDVLLVESDLRRPVSSNRLGLVCKQGLGLAEHLSGLCTLDQAIRRHNTIPHLSILPSGVLPPNPAELLASNKLPEILSNLKERYRYVILDSPPILSVADPLILSVHTDAVLLVIRQGKTQREAIVQATNSILRVGVQPKGIVFNAMDPRNGDSYYSSSDYYYPASGQDSV